MQLNNRVALVTSSRRGNCASISRQLAHSGARVMICGRNATEGRATVAQIQRDGGRASFILADTASSADVQAAIDETIATYGRLDILFNSISAQYAQDSALLDVSETAWDRVSENNLKGTFLCCQYAIPFLQKSGRNAGHGLIINLIESPPLEQVRTVASICQGGVLAMTCAIAQQFPTQHISANVIWVAQSPEPAIINLTSEKILYGPLRQSTQDEAVPPFLNVTDAVSYLTNEGEHLHGYVLMVTSEPHASASNV